VELCSGPARVQNSHGALCHAADAAAASAAVAATRHGGGRFRARRNAELREAFEFFHPPSQERELLR